MRYICFFVAFFCLLYSYSQEDTERIKFQGFSFGFPTVYQDNQDGGLSLMFDVGVYKSKHILKFSFLTGSDVDILDDADYEFSSFDIMYGREIELQRRIYFDVFAGLGLFHETHIINKASGGGTSSTFGGFHFSGFATEKVGEDNNNTIALPLQAKLRFVTGRSVSLGLLAHANINALNPMMHFGLLVQWNFNTVLKKKS